MHWAAKGNRDNFSCDSFIERPAPVPVHNNISCLYLMVEFNIFISFELFILLNFLFLCSFHGISGALNISFFSLFSLQVGLFLFKQHTFLFIPLDIFSIIIFISFANALSSFSMGQFSVFARL